MSEEFIFEYDGDKFMIYADPWKEARKHGVSFEGKGISDNYQWFIDHEDDD